MLHCSWHAKPFLQFFDSDLQNVDLTSPSLYIYQCISFATLLLKALPYKWCPTVQYWYLRSLHEMEFFYRMVYIFMQMLCCCRMCRSWHCTEDSTPLHGGPALSLSFSVSGARRDVTHLFQRWSSVRTKDGMAWIYRWGLFQHLGAWFYPMRQIHIMLELSDP